MPKHHPQRVIDYIIKLQDLWFSTRQISAKILDEHNYKIAHTSINDIERRVGKAIAEYAEENDTDIDTVRHLRHKTKLEDWSRVSAFIKNPWEKIGRLKVQKQILDNIQKYSPKYPTIKRKKSKDWHLLVIDPADVHIGKLCSAFETGETYNNQIAVQRVLQGVKWILEKTSTYHIDKVLFVAWNDILHIDTPSRKTTSWTPQDTDWMWYDNFVIAKKLYIDVLEMILSVADVEFVYNPSNHDFTHGFFLCQTIESWFSRNKNINFHTNMMHRKYIQYWSNLIGTTHWDWAKEKDLALLMATEQPIMRSTTQHRYRYTHHIHHKTSKDYMSVCVESMRSPSGADWRHHRNAYQHAPKAIEGFIHHKQHGQIWRFTHLF